MVAGSHDFTAPAPSPMSYRPTASLTAAGKTTAPHVVPQTSSPVAVPPVNATVPVTQQPISITPPAGKSTGNRGLYIALGSVIVLVALVAAGIYLPGRGRSSVAADSSQGTASSASASMPEPHATPSVAEQQTQSQPTTPSTTAEPAKPAETTTSAPPVEAPSVPAETKTPAPPAKKLMAKNSPPQQIPPPPSDNAQAQASAASSAQLDEIEHQIDQLHTRAGSVNSSLERMQREQSAAGYGLRGDIATRWTSMKLNLSKAQNAIEHNDAARAKRYADAADSDMSALESFLGH